jgi:hypothetical protein
MLTYLSTFSIINPLPTHYTQNLCSTNGLRDYLQFFAPTDRGMYL